MDLLTITSSDVAGDKMEPALSGLFPDYPIAYNQRPPAFPNKEVFFISARVHPGEVLYHIMFLSLVISNLPLKYMYYLPC